MMFKYFFLSYICLVLTSCQIYRNSGRNLFEANSPRQIPNTDLTTSEVKDDDTPSQKNNLECWSQPKNEALWIVNPNSNYKVKLIDEHTLEVCLNESAENNFSN